MKPFFLTYFLLSFWVVHAYDWQSLGARHSALGNASVAANGVWFIQHNQAGLSHLENTSFDFAVENRFGLSELSTANAYLLL